MAAASLLAFAAPAQAAPTSFWFDCTGTLPLQTVDVATYSWSDKPPAKSYQEGAGCGWLDPSGITGTNQPNPFYDAAFGGDYAGEVRKLELTLYAPVTPATTKAIDLKVTANGEEIALVEGVVPTVAAGPNDNIKALTYTVSGLNVPAGADPSAYVLAVASTFIDDTPGWLLGAKEVPSNVRFFAFGDLTPEEQAEIMCAEDETLCTE